MGPRHHDPTVSRVDFLALRKKYKRSMAEYKLFRQKTDNIEFLKDEHIKLMFKLGKYRLIKVV